MAVTAQRGPAGTLLVDSGAADHLFHHDFATESSSKQSTGKLRDVQGNTLSHHGTRLNLTVGTQGQRANIDFQVADISDKILSSRKLLRNGSVFRFNGESTTQSCITEPTTVPLFPHKNSFRIHARPLIHHVRLVAEDGSPVRLSSRSPTNLLDRRLDKVALREHGTKRDKWTPVDQRENELSRGRRAQAAHDAERTVGRDGWDGRTKTEREVHELTHLPQQWCDHCVKGQILTEA